MCIVRTASLIKYLENTEDLAVNDVTAATQGVAALISEVGLPFHIITIGTAVLTLSYGTSRCSGCRLLLLLLDIIFCGEWRGENKKRPIKKRRFWRIANTLAKME